jgi:multicomponent Na+:H+ antiporter subunit C
VTVYPYIVAVFVFFVGALGIVRSRNMIHAVVCLSVAQSGTYLLLLEV